MSSQSKPDTAFALSLIGGILMVIGGGITSMWFTSGGLGIAGMMGGFGGGIIGGMGGFPWMLGGAFGANFGLMSALTMVGLIAGLVVLTASILLNSRPADSKTWGTIILVFSIVSLIGMGGFVIGALLGIAGGALALSWRPVGPRLVE